MVYDCFTFFNEFDLLQVRLAELSAVVHKFVLVEATRIFSGKPKPCHYRDHQAQFASYHHQLIHIVVDNMPDGPNVSAWDREHFQRNAITRGLTRCSSQDIIIVSDVDEIVDAHIFPFLEVRVPCHLGMEMYYFYLNCYQRYGWAFPAAASHHQLIHQYGGSPEALRWAKVGVVEHAGWHFSHLGGADAIKMKVEAYSHQEHNTPEFKVGIAVKLANLQDLYEGGYKHTLVPVNEKLPPYIRSHETEFRRKGLIK